MFERFTPELRQAVVDAQDRCRDVGAEEISTEHLFFGLLAQHSGFAAEFLPDRLPDAAQLETEFAQVRRRGDLSDSDTEALGTLGIDLARVVDAVERAHGENALAPQRRRTSSRGFRRNRVADHVPFSREAKAALEQSLQEALGLGDRHIGGEHLLLALLRLRTIAGDVLRSHAITESLVREALPTRRAG